MTGQPYRYMTENLPAEIASDEENIEDRFIENLSIYVDPRKAALEAGYSESYSLNIKTHKFRNPRFIKRLTEHYKGHSATLLPAILQIESSSIQLTHDLLSKALQESDPEIQEDMIKKAMSVYTKTANTRREIKQSTGVLEVEQGARPIFKSVQNVQNILLGVHEPGDRETVYVSSNT